jgi:hypothetical protein
MNRAARHPQTTTTETDPMTDSFDEETLPEIDPAAPSRDSSGGSREVCFHDFKDGATRVIVAQRPADPSRICITLRSEQALIDISIEETVGQQIADGLARVLPDFRAARRSGR